jgi:vacuolar-type H+-ATPase subunit F/Vma7
MISLIGASTTIIGFGLCGIKDIFELRRTAKKEEILQSIREAQHNLILIDQFFYEKIKKDIPREFSDKVFIKIPDRYEEFDEDIDELVKDTLGITLQENKK